MCCVKEEGVSKEVETRRGRKIVAVEVMGGDRRRQRATKSQVRGGGVTWQGKEGAMLMVAAWCADLTPAHLIQLQVAVLGHR